MALTSAKILKMGVVVRFCFLLSFVTYFAQSHKSLVQELSEDNWSEILEGEWFVKFYAPWCPACQSLAAVWERMAEQVQELNIRVAEVDVTNNPALSGRFFVTALPTIFHIKDGIFRQYKQARSEQSLYEFVAKNKWQDVEPIPWYLSPTSIHMSFLGTFFRFSIIIKDIHNTMTSDYGIPVWASYAIFAIVTILTGLFIGLLIVCLCDLRQPSHKPSQQSSSTKKNKDTALDDTKESKAQHSDLSDIDEEESKPNDRVNKMNRSPEECQPTVRHREPKADSD